MKIKKVKAFTLSELLVVMLLTVIVVGLAFAVLNLVQKQMFLAQKNYQVNTELDRLKQVLWIDFRSHSQAFYNADLQLLSIANALHKIDYQFVEDYVVRQQDTFNINLATRKVFNMGEETVQGRVDALELLTSKTSGGKLVFVYRKNTAENYINQ